MRSPLVLAHLCLAVVVGFAAPASLEAGCNNPQCSSCNAAPACECQKCSSPKNKGLLSAADGMMSKLCSKSKKLFGFKKKSKCSGACDAEPCNSCDVEPTCGCEVEPDCGCETAPSCGCSNCQSSTSNYSPAPIQRVQPQAPASALPIVPAPTPLNDSEIDPFMDDAVNRVRKIPAKTINYERKQKPSYGTRYDPQASSGVSFNFRDIVPASANSVSDSGASSSRNGEVVSASATLIRRAMWSRAKRLPTKDEKESSANPLRP